MIDSQQLENRKQEDFSAARKLLHQLLSADSIVNELEGQDSANAKQVYANAATIFALVLQRLAGGLTLKEIVKKMIDQHRDMLLAAWSQKSGVCTEVKRPVKSNS